MTRFTPTLMVCGLVAGGLLGGGYALAGPEPSAENSSAHSKETTRQVSLQPIEKPEAGAQDASPQPIKQGAGSSAVKTTESADAATNKKDRGQTNGSGSKPKKPAMERASTPPNLPKMTEPPSLPAKKGPARAKDEATTSGKRTSESGRVVNPGLPHRKPKKPVVRETSDLRESKDKKKGEAPAAGPDREKYLCKALQACRNEFIRCKGKITYPDQSKEWSVAKEECGAHYKACVEKDFRPGEWFFTRWFYFQELKCE